MEVFKLSDNFIEQYKDKKPPFGFGKLGELVYIRTYSRIKDDGMNEQWYETCRRVVEGTYRMQKRHIEAHGLEWNAWQAQRSAQEMYERMFSMKFLPPGRGLWAMGSPITEERGLYASLNNCAYVSTKTLKDDGAKPFIFLMDASMLGVGVGFDTIGAGQLVIKSPNEKRETELYKIPDTREGWVESLRLLIESYFYATGAVKFDYSLLRQEGMPIKGFGGISSGHKPLENMHVAIRKVLDTEVGSPISVTTIVNIMNLIGKAVVAGNVRRTAEIAFGDYTDKEYLDLKNYKKNPKRESFGWTSNNSVFAKVGMDYSPVCERIMINGEPGLAWLENMRAYSRMNDGRDNKDYRADGGNPCLEQTLESYEVCCTSGDTKVQTKTGVYQIADLVGKQVKMWNGVKWAKTTPFIAGRNKQLYRVTISDGSYLDCTGDHKWSVRARTQRKFKQIETSDLSIGSYVSKFSIGNEYVSGKRENFAFEWGLFAGDGYIDKKSVMLILCGNKRTLGKMNIRGRWYKEQIKEGYTDPVQHINLKDNLDLQKAIELNDKTLGLPAWVFEMDKRSILEFLAGYIESDGNVDNKSNAHHYRIFGVEKKMRDLQLLLRRVGINHASVYKGASKGDITNFGIRNYDLWVCYIPSVECSQIPMILKKATIFSNGKKPNNAHAAAKSISCLREQKIKRIELLPGHHTTYCVSEPKTHMVVFNNVLTYQCLVETFPFNHETKEDYLRTLKFAYLYAKTVTLGKTHWPETNRVMLRNRRIGCSVSGIAQFIDKRGIDILREWLVAGYDTIQDWDKTYSDWMAIPRSIKTTSVKPSGSVSLLAGATPGLHRLESRYYIRRVQLSKISVLVKMLESAGYVIEPCVGAEDTTVVVEIPVDSGEGVRTVKETSMWEQLSVAAFLQQYWADNQVSATISFDPTTEGNQLRHALDFFQYRLKGISFLPRHEYGAYKQMPYEAIDEKTYHNKINKIKKFNMSNIKGEEADVERFCSNDVCEVPSKTP
jgi:intein/homing endonuclease